jgi:hypothetical protein
MLAPAAAGGGGDADRRCDFGLRGGDESGWDPDDDDGEFEDAFLVAGGDGDARRDDAFDGYGNPEVDGEGYDNPDPEDKGCELSDDQDTLRFPSDLVAPGIRLTPQLYAGDNRAVGRQYVTIRNNGDAPVTVDFGWQGDLGSDSGTNVDRTSSGDGVVDTSDRWATSCEDPGDDGCVDVGGESDRDPELAHNWERDGGERDSAEVIDLEDGNGNYDVTFEDVTIGPGQSAAYMEIVSLRRGIFKAREAAREAGAAPSYVFAGLSNGERSRLRNW